MSRKLNDYLVLGLKGIAMGAADVVPGVSGGTIAFISGIYEELLASILASLSEAELQALSTETNQAAATLRLTTHIEDLAATNTLLAAWLAQ